MTKEEAIKYLKQIYPNGGHCWLDEQRIQAIDTAIQALQEFTHVESSDDPKQAALHYMEDCQEVDDFVRRGIDEIAERYFREGAKWMAGQGVTVEEAALNKSMFK